MSIKALAMAVVFSMLSAAGQATAAELTIAAPDTAEARSLRALAAHWTASSGHTLDWLLLEPATFQESLREDGFAGENSVDIVMAEAPEIALLAGAGELAPLETLGDEGNGEAMADIFPAVRQSLTHAGELYAAPIHAEAALTYFRADALRAAGLEMPQSPNLADLRRLAAALHAPEDGRFGLCLRTRAGWGENMAVLSQFLGAVGGDAVQPPPLELTAAPWREAAVTYVDMLGTFGPPASEGNRGFADLLAAFSAGRCAIWIDSTTAAPLLAERLGEEFRDQVGIRPAPGAGGAEVGWLSVTGLAVLTASPERAAAADFVAWVTSRNAALVAIARDGWTAAPLGTRRSTLERAPTAIRSAYGDAVHAAMMVAAPMVFAEAAARHAVDLRDLHARLGDALRAALAGEQPVAAALAAAERDLARELWALRGAIAAPQSLEREVTAPTPTRADGSDSRGAGVRAARLFAGPEQYPPDAFAAYGIVAFRAMASRADRERHLMICEAYKAALPRSGDLGLPVAEQMVTIWPVNDIKIADDLNQGRLDDACDKAVNNYDLPVALQALADAGLDQLGAGRAGPFLLAWSPADAKGAPDALVLQADLTNVITYEQAQEVFLLWRRDIEMNPAYWSNGWDLERVRLAIRLWVDRFGPQILSILGG